MKQWALVGLSAFLSVSSLGAATKPVAKMNVHKSDEDSQLPKVIKVERGSPVFKSPSAKSKILADVDSGTVLIARSLSPKGSWLYVEDEDGNKGWIPVNRTNYRSQTAPVEEVADEDVADAVKEDEATKNPIPSRETLSIVEGGLSNYGFGGSYSYLVKQTQDSPFSRERRIGLEVGAYREWALKISQARNTTVPILIRMSARDPGSSFFSGPDLGAQYRIKDKSWGSALGYSLGYVTKATEGFSTRVRFGIELGGRTRYAWNWNMGWQF